LSRDLAVIEHGGVAALRNGKKWSEFGVSVERPLDPLEAVRKVNSLEVESNRPPDLRPQLAASHRSGNIVLQAERAVIGYPGHRLFTIRDLELRRSERAALIGPNGSGKTTFLKCLLGQLEPLEGEVKLGASLKIGYFAQAHDALNSQRSVLEEFLSHKDMRLEQARSYLARYLFRGDDVFKPVTALSGGERARLALAILALDGANLLLLDEPTNHLDIPAQEALQEVLESFSGTILLVSHDRYLIDRLATQIWELRDGQLHVFKGDYQEYALHRTAVVPRARNQPSLLLKKQMLRVDGKQARKRALEIDMLEERIRDQEAIIQRLNGDLQKAGQSGASNGSKAFERIHQLSWQVAQAQVALDKLLEEWEKLAV
jgi:ATP-binding cassette subfamily F protein 3